MVTYKVLESAFALLQLPTVKYDYVELGALFGVNAGSLRKALTKRMKARAAKLAQQQQQQQQRPPSAAAPSLAPAALAPAALVPAPTLPSALSNGCLAPAPSDAVMAPSSMQQHHQQQQQQQHMYGSLLQQHWQQYEQLHRQQQQQMMLATPEPPPPAAVVAYVRELQEAHERTKLELRREKEKSALLVVKLLELERANSALLGGQSIVAPAVSAPPQLAAQAVGGQPIQANELQPSSEQRGDLKRKEEAFDPSQEQPQRKRSRPEPSDGDSGQPIEQVDSELEPEDSSSSPSVPRGIAPTMLAPVGHQSVIPSLENLASADQAVGRGVDG